MAVGVKITAFWDRTLCNLVDIYEYFEGISCLRQSIRDTSNAWFKPTTRQMTIMLHMSGQNEEACGLGLFEASTKYVCRK